MLQCRAVRDAAAVAGPAYPLDAANEIDMLKAHADYLKKSLDAVNKRIDELKDKPAD